MAANPPPPPPPEKTLNDYARPDINNIKASIIRPTISANTFEIKPHVFQLIQQSVQFYGLKDEDANQHIRDFLEICDLFKINGVSDDAIRLRLFPFSVKDKAKNWLESLPVSSISTWDDLCSKFLMRYCPPAKIAKLRNDITSYQYQDGESLYDTWERFKDLLRRCPQHGLELWNQIFIFYNGLSATTRQMIDAAAGGALGSRDPKACYELIEDMAMNSYQWNSPRIKPPIKAASIFQLDALTSLTAQVQALSKKIETTQIQNEQPSNTLCLNNNQQEGELNTDNSNIQIEEVDYVGQQQRPQNDPYANTYNPGWRNHPNFGWRNGTANSTQPPPGIPYPPKPQITYNQPTNQNSNQPQGQQTQQTGYQQRQQQGYQNQRPPSNLENILNKYIQTTDAVLRNQQASLQALENQLGQISKAIAERTPGKLPSNTDSNPKEQVQAITLRSGKETVPPTISSKPLTYSNSDKSEIPDTTQPKIHIHKPTIQQEKNEPNIYIHKPTLPYPQRLKKEKMKNNMESS